VERSATSGQRNFQSTSSNNKNEGVNNAASHELPDNNEKKEDWRPGLNSWMPGQGVPKNHENHPGEAKPKKEHSQKPFPGQ